MLDLPKREPAAAARTPASRAARDPFRWVLTGLAAAGALVVGLVGFREHQGVLALERLRFESAATAHFEAFADHLEERETLARAVAAAFSPPPAAAPGILAREVDPRLLDFLPDITSFVWAPRVAPDQAEATLAALAADGVERPAFLGAGRDPLAEPPAARERVVVVDVRPRSAENLSSRGLDLTSLPIPRAALDAAEASRDIAATAPLELVQFPGDRALVLYAPVFARGGGDGRALGYLGFSFRLRHFLGAAMERAGGADLRVAVADAGGPEPQPLIASAEPRGVGGTALERRLSFGGRPWTVAYAPADPPERKARSAALRAGGVGALAVVAALAAAWTLVAAGRRLQRAVAGQVKAEAQLRTIIAELNHRSRNTLAVVQAMASQTLRSAGASPELGEALSGRLQAMAQATTLLAESEWRGIGLREAAARSGLPFAERVRVEGPDVTLAPGQRKTSCSSFTSSGPTPRSTARCRSRTARSI